MKKWKILLPCALILCAVAALLAVCLTTPPAIGRCIVGDNGTVFFLDDANPSTPIILHTRCDLSYLKTGDRLLVLYGVVAESYPAQTSARLCVRLAHGSEADVNADTLRSLREMGWVS